MSVRLQRDGRDVATWTLSNPPAGTPQVEIDGVWHDLTVSGSLASLSVCGPTMSPPYAGAVVVQTSQCPRVRVDGVIRTADGIYLI